VTSVRASVASTKWGGWVRSLSEEKSKVEMSEAERAELRQAEAFLAHLEGEYSDSQRTNKRGQGGVETSPENDR
jgi:hypothetical protein